MAVLETCDASMPTASADASFAGTHLPAASGGRVERLVAWISPGTCEVGTLRYRFQSKSRERCANPVRFGREMMLAVDGEAAALVAHEAGKASVSVLGSGARRPKGLCGDAAEQVSRVA